MPDQVIISVVIAAGGVAFVIYLLESSKVKATFKEIETKFAKVGSEVMKEVTKTAGLMANFTSELASSISEMYVETTEGALEFQKMIHTEFIPGILTAGSGVGETTMELQNALFEESVKTVVEPLRASLDMNPELSQTYIDFIQANIALRVAAYSAAIDCGTEISKFGTTAATQVFNFFISAFTSSLIETMNVTEGIRAGILFFADALYDSMKDISSFTIEQVQEIATSLVGLATKLRIVLTEFLSVLLIEVKGVANALLNIPKDAIRETVNGGITIVTKTVDDTFGRLKDIIDALQPVITKVENSLGQFENFAETILPLSNSFNDLKVVFDRAKDATAVLQNFHF